jgi:hypothetical protein
MSLWCSADLDIRRMRARRVQQQEEEQPEDLLPHSFTKHQVEPFEVRSCCWIHLSIIVALSAVAAFHHDGYSDLNHRLPTIITPHRPPSACWVFLLTLSGPAYFQRLPSPPPCASLPQGVLLMTSKGFVVPRLLLEGCKCLAAVMRQVNGGESMWWDMQVAMVA